MTQFPGGFWRIVFSLVCSSCLLPAAPAPSSDGNRLTYLDEPNPFYPSLSFARLTTPQWVGERGVDAVVILAIDDMGAPPKYEAMLRPILERLKKIDGRAPVSIMSTRFDPAHPQLTQWLQEGVSLEVHTLAHPCPFLAGSNFVAAAETYHRGVELLHQVPGNKPVAFRMPCCDSINSPSPRFYSEMFNATNSAGQYLSIDSSVMTILTSADPALRREWVVDADGKDKFRKYVPFPSFVTTIENYPYPYVIGRLCWEFPAMVPSDWEAQHLQGTNNPATVRDWEAALDATVAKQGTFTFIFHPHGWIRSDQMVEFIGYAQKRYGSRVKFLNFQEAKQRLDQHLLAGHPLRRADGGDNGVRLLDLNHDGFLDVVVGNERTRLSRLWSPKDQTWVEAPFPTVLVKRQESGAYAATGVQFGIVEQDGFASAYVNGDEKGAWHFDGHAWNVIPGGWTGADIDGRPAVTSEQGRDRGVRLRDVDQDGRCELIVGNDTQNAVFAWSDQEEAWRRLPFGLPKGASLVTAEGADAGLRFVDVNEDGYDDVLISDESHYSLHLFVKEYFLGFQQGWTREVITGRRGDRLGEIPQIVRGGAHPNNGAWFHSRHLWVQNEDTATLPDYVDRRSFDTLLAGLTPKPKTPAESLACLRVRPGFKVELVASEPLVRDPIAFEWGADGRLWVVEMGDYPLGLDGKGAPGGVVRFLEDLDGDGHYDKSTVFLDHQNFPTGVMPWRKGVLVSAAPEIFYAEDRDGDGRADFKVTLFRGFHEGNQQHRVNGFEYGLDNWVYGANGDSGGRITPVGSLPGFSLSTSSSPASEPIDLRGHDFRFQPDLALFETVSGQTQYGRHRDDWGNWFGNNNPTWLWHVFVPEEYVARNPHLPVRTVKRILANYPDSTRTFPASRTMQRFNDIGMVNHVTSANSAAPYRDDLFGGEFSTSVFISEPVHNVIHREVLVADGVTFQSQRAAEEQETEFLTSTDNWFRPVMLKTGPDGALYCADMYRLVLEHPEWIPADTQQHLDLRAGAELGRIYRIFPEKATLRPIPKLEGRSPVELVAFLESPNGWTRDTAQRLLCHAADPSAVPALERLSTNAPSPKTRLQALCTLEGMGKLQPATVLTALCDLEPAVREHAVRLSERWLQEQSRDVSSEGSVRALKERLLALVEDPAVRVRYQLAFSLGNWHEPAAADALANLGAREENEPLLQQAILSSATPHLGRMLEVLLTGAGQKFPPVHLLKELLSLTVSTGNSDALASALTQLRPGEQTTSDLWKFSAVAGLLEGMERSGQSLSQFRQGSSARVQSLLDALNPLFRRARELAVRTTAPESERILALPLLGRGLEEQGTDRRLLASFLRPQAPTSLQHAAAAHLARLDAADVADLILEDWRSYEPALRAELLNALISRPGWSAKLISAIREGTVPSAQVGAFVQQKLVNSSHVDVRMAAQELFSVSRDRRDLLKSYRDVLDLAGQPARGRALFQQHCASCHRLQKEGQNVGPDLGALAGKTPETVLIAILDPNRAVEARYLNFQATTQSGRELSGIIVAETPSSITLRTSGGLEETILRSDLGALSSSGLSLMPEGLEKAMSKQDLADLIAFVLRPN